MKKRNKIIELNVFELNRLGYNGKINDKQIIKECTYNNYFIYDKSTDEFYGYDYDKQIKESCTYAWYLGNLKQNKIELLDSDMK